MRWGRVALIAIPLLALAASRRWFRRPPRARGRFDPLSPSRGRPRARCRRSRAARGDNAPLVVIDAGHGGRDPGASSALGGEPESRVTLALAVAMRDALAATGRVRVALTRSDDTLYRA